MEACEPALQTPDNIMRHLDVLFQDTAMQQKALDWLQSARQRNIPLTTFIPDFNTKILEAGGQSWEDRMKITKLKNMQNSGRRHYTPVTYTPAPTDNPATHTPAPKNNDADAMNWIDSNAYAQARVSAIQTGFRVPGITPEEVTDRHQHGVCINCNRSGHIASNCRSTYVPPHSRERSAPVRANHVTLEEDSEDNYEKAPMKQGKD
ncbi:hypothetical protein BDDG_13267 [Blastomyces dermatitidis ATCC 18188]|uniref:CCHC-type domain-containing protein n=1 Tax=Ajellomyces dermatitidis (strain ATCC 18188 / CBS 674.68) TaxID=653446 RepID=A0A0J9HIT6_AJEDA|nr:hypothetical protein BDDG_13267 [Blastomyces dermatitidis ATCC 18188]